MIKPNPGKTTMLLPAFLAAVAVSACYNPNVVPGLACAPAGKACPDGFECIGTRCLKLGTVLGTGGTGTGGTGTGGIDGTGGEQGTGGGSGGTGAGGVKQTCTTAPPPAGTCESDLLCLADCAQSRCYRFCTSDADCSGPGSCKPGVAPRVCEWEDDACDPINHDAAPCGSATPCFLLSSPANRTVCDCLQGDRTVGQPCTDSRQCFAGLFCPPPTLAGGGFCRRVCDPQGAPCQVAPSCTPFGPRWGYCFP